MKSSEELGADLLHCLPRPLTEHLEGTEADEGLELALHAVLTPLTLGGSFNRLRPGGKSGSGDDQPHAFPLPIPHSLITVTPTSSLLFSSPLFARFFRTVYLLVN